MGKSLNSAKEIVGQGKKVSGVLNSNKAAAKELLQLDENKENTLLTDIFDVLEKS
jgi:hypothetical protein